jgi:predicted ATPase
MKIERITLEGFTNIEKVDLNLLHINALLAFNNYGKSNVMRAIDFGVSFIKANTEQKRRQMSYQPAVPINNAIANKPFAFEVEGSISVENSETNFIYRYSFEWIKSGRAKGRKIKSESLKLKKQDDLKYTAYIQRDANGAFYLSSPKGRCDKSIVIEGDNLVINKISNFDDLFYLTAIKELLSMEVWMIDTMDNPNNLFRRIYPQLTTSESSLRINENSDVGAFVYKLKKCKPNTFELFKDAVKSLLPSIDDFEPIEIDLKQHSQIDKDADNIPFSLPEKFYDIRVKEFYNNQQTSINSISSGSKRIFYILAMCVGADINNIPLIMFEELENSIHPTLFQNLLITLDSLCEDTKMIISSHSPYLIKYLNVEKMKLGIPNNSGIAIFKNIRPSKINKISRLASEEEISIGDYLFSLMLDASAGESETLNEICQ